MPTPTLKHFLAAATSLTLEEPTTASATTGYQPRLEILAYTGAPLDVWGSKYVIDLKGLKPAKGKIPILLNHDYTIENIIGQADTFELTDDHLTLGATVIGTSQNVKRFIELAAAGFEWQASVGIYIDKLKEIPPDKEITANGRTYTGPLYLITKSRLVEVSAVVLGNDNNTSTTLATGPQPMPAPHHDQHHITADHTPTDAPAPDITAIREAAAAELERIAAIQKLAASHPDIAAAAIREGWDATKTELEILRATRAAAAPAIHTRDDAHTFRALEAALCLSIGLPEPYLSAHYDAPTLEASARYRNAGIHALLYETIRAAGYHVRPGVMDNDTIRMAFDADRILRASAGFSTATLTGILSNVANKALLQAYEAVATVAPIIARESDVKDFKQAVRFRLSGLDTFDKVAPTGELKTAAVSDDVYTNQLDTYGVVVTLSRQMIINDDLGAFMEMPRLMGRKAAIQRERALFELLLANPSNFFSSANKNYISGTDTALSIAALTKAEQTMLDQTDTSGNPLLITPALLLVPSTLKVTAQQLMTETRVNETTATGKPSPANNPHAGKWQPVASPFLNAMGLTGSSATAWYLLANPQDVAAIEIVYLQGRRTPTIESGEADMNTLGMKWRAYWDFGVALQDPRAAVKSAGA